MTAGPRAPSRGRRWPTATCGARAPPPRCSGSGPWPGGWRRGRRRPDAACAELARYKLGRISADDADGYHRVECPAAAGKLRCPLKPASLALGFDRPEVLGPPELPPRCCTQATITVPPSVNAKSRQKHDHPSPAHRRSHARRSGAERSFSTTKDPATTDVRRGWCRLLGRTKNLVMYACAAVVRNLGVVAGSSGAKPTRPAAPSPTSRRAPASDDAEAGATPA